MFGEIELRISNDLPCAKENLCQFTCDNLISTIDYLHRYNLELLSEIKNLNRRICRMEDLKAVVDQITIKSDNYEKRINDLELSSTNSNSKIMEHELRLNALEKKQKINDIKLINQEKLILDNGKLIRLLDKNLKDNSNKITEIIQVNELKEYSLENNKKNIDEIKKYVNMNITNMAKDSELKTRHIEKLNKDYNDINGQIAEVKSNIDTKNNQIERSITSIINSISNGQLDDNYIDTNNLNNIPSNINNRKKETAESLFKILMSQMERDKKEMQNFMEDYKYKQEKLNNDFLLINRNIADNKKNYKELQILIKEQNENIKYYATSNELKKLSDNISILTRAINDNPSKNDYENLKNNINIRFQQIKTKINELKNIEENDKNKNDDNISLNANMAESINSLISDLMKSEGKNIDISQNKHFIQLMKLNEKNRGDIDKSKKFFTEIQNIIFDNPIKKIVEDISKKLDKFIREYKGFKIKFNEMSKLIGISTDDDDSSENQKLKNEILGSKESLIDKIENLISNFKVTNEKVYKIDKKVNSLTKEIKDDIKNNLKFETFKVVDKFQSKLNTFSEKFEYELKNKIDRMGLNSFENKINNRFTTDLKQKLSRNELRKNNNMFNRKIESLENKISKTLVDTIIDLQMDDAPLLVKKTGSKIDLCASCNRPLCENININNYNEKDYMSPKLIRTSRSIFHNVPSVKKFPPVTHTENNE